MECKEEPDDGWQEELDDLIETLWNVKYAQAAVEDADSEI